VRACPVRALVRGDERRWGFEEGGIDVREDDGTAWDEAGALELLRRLLLLGAVGRDEDDDMEDPKRALRLASASLL